MNKKKFLLTILIFLSIFNFSLVNASNASKENDKNSDFEQYMIFRDIDKGTFIEYGYLVVRNYLRLKEYYELNEQIDKSICEEIIKNAEKGYKYLPDHLKNENYLNDVKIAVKKGISKPNSEVYYTEIGKKIETYLGKVTIQKIKGSIEATPSSGNAPLTVTFKAKNVIDPSGTIIPESNYIWWMDVGGTKKIIGKGLLLNYTFKEQKEYTVFLDVKSNHKNKSGYTDVLSFSTRSVIQVKEKIASLIININGTSLKENEEVKFTPDEASYGLIFDATSSTPTGGAKFKRTEWNFGNGVTKKYDGNPQIERVIYSREGEFEVSLKLTTNEEKTVERKFIVIVRKPIATINSNIEDGYIGDKFIFSAKSTVNEKNLSFTWNIIDIGNDKILTTKNGNILNYSFNNKGRYNIQLKVKDSAGNEDADTKIIYVNSRAPIAEFTYSIPDKSKPNRVLFDGTKSYDSDISDQGKLKYIWTINGEIVEIESVDNKGAIGYYIFDSIGDHNISLEVIDPDEMSSIKTQKISIESILSVEFFPFPRVIQRDMVMRFVTTSPNAKYYEWDFGDGNTQNTSSSKEMKHTFDKSGVFNVKLTVKDADGKSNETSRTVYVGESNAPYAMIGVDYGSSEIPAFDNSACSGGAYIINRSKTVSFKGSESLNLDGTTNGLTYTWKIGNNKYVTDRDTTFKFDELGCYPIKLTVKSDTNGSTHSFETWVKVENLKPTLNSINVVTQNENLDPVVVSISAIGATDPDGVIQSYLWYYYTDTDPEPQDFRITALPNTTFVIPKVSGNYYFVVTMRDNNDERYSSQEISENKYFITLNGDNVNTPLIDFKVNKNNLYIGEEATFNATAKSVLGQDITSKAQFAWDFDGDGFYDKETDVGDVSHKFENSGTFYSKVRVKYKGMTNVRTIEMNVANILEPSFEYVSIGDTYVFFNTSAGKYDSSVWDMGDGNEINNKNYFVYNYEDKQRVHEVNLKISEGTKLKDISQEVTKSFKNMNLAKNSDGLYFISNPKIESGKIEVKDSSGKVVVYIYPKQGVKNYAIDFDILSDSDLNGTKDDDIDNKSDSSYTDAGTVEIILNDKKSQTVRIFSLDENGKIVESKDVILNKNYVKDEEIDIKTLTFSGVTDSEKTKIEKLKSYIQGLPQEHRLKSMKYVQMLQENWFYINEKTKIILEFEAFIDSLGISNSKDIINLLESFLIEGQEDQSFRNMAYNTVKNLIPKELVEYKEIIGNLDQINSNPDKLEENKVLGKEILEMIKDTSLIKNEDKNTIKAQLLVFIYGSPENIPESAKGEVKKNDPVSNSGVLGKFKSLFSGILGVTGIIIGAIIFIIIGFFVWFKISNKNKNQGLQDFIIEKTSGQKDDILSGMSSNDAKKEEISSIIRPKKEIEKPVIKEEKKEVKDIFAKTEDDVFKNFEKVDSKSIKDDKIPETKIEEDKVPDWLKTSMGEKKEEKKDIFVKEEKKEENVLQKVEKDEIKSIEEDKIPETKIEEDKIPDWLKGVITEDKINSKKIEEDFANSTFDEVVEEEKPKKAKSKKPLENNEDVFNNKANEEKKTKKAPIVNKIQNNEDNGIFSKDEKNDPLNLNNNSTDKKNTEKKDDFWTLDNVKNEDE